MFLGIDHLVIAVADPDQGAAQLEQELGLAATGGGRHDALGTFNRLIWLGDSYLELVGVFDRRLAESSWLGAPTLRTLETGGGLATWAIATDELDRDLVALGAAGSDLGQPIAGDRRRTDGRIVHWRISLPPHLGPGEPPFLIEHSPTSAEWTPTDRATRSAQRHPIGGPVRIEALELPVDDVNASIQRLLRTTGLRFRPSLSGGGSRDADIGGQIVRLRPRRGGSGSAVIRLTAPIPEPRTAELLGCRWFVRPKTA
jgi:glyoxalase-like protein